MRRALQESPGAIVAVCGCFSQLSPGETKALGAHLVSGSGDRMKFVDELERIYETRSEKVLRDATSAKGKGAVAVYRAKDGEIVITDIEIDGKSVIARAREVAQNEVQHER